MNRLSMPLTARDHIQGLRDATMQLVEYGDYECPHCKAAHPVVRLLQAEFDTNLRLAYIKTAVEDRRTIYKPKLNNASL